MQNPAEIEAHYATPDPWGYRTNPCDIKRRSFIYDALAMTCHVDKRKKFARALDIGAGEGWITQILPAEILHGWEISPTARSRMPREVIPIVEPEGKYDLVTATGVLYSHYEAPFFFAMIKEHASDIILTCNIKSWERPELSDPDWVKGYLEAEEIHTEEFSYREFTQKLRIFKKIKGDELESA